MKTRASPNAGLTVLESLVGLGIILLLAGLAIWPFRGLRDEQLLAGAVEEAASLLDAARVKTLAGVGDERYGVHFESDTIILFRGDLYPGVTETVVLLHPRVVVAEIGLGGGAEVIFDRLTGVTGNPGYVAVGLADDPSERRFINIYASGLIDVQF